MPIFKHPNYEREAERLMADPIIVQMAAELPSGWDNTELEAWSFVSGASTTYHARGGRLDFSIGGPAEAIKRLYAKRQ